MVLAPIEVTSSGGVRPLIVCRMTGDRDSLREFRGRSSDFFLQGVGLGETSQMCHLSWPCLKSDRGFGLVATGQKEPRRQRKGRGREHPNELKGQQ